MSLQSIERLLTEYRNLRYGFLLALSIWMFYRVTTPRPFLEQLKLDYIECIKNPVMIEIGDRKVPSIKHCETIRSVVRETEPDFMLTEEEIEQTKLETEKKQQEKEAKEDQKQLLEQQTKKCRELLFEHKYSNFKSPKSDFEQRCLESNTSIAKFFYWSQGKKVFCGVKLSRDFSKILDYSGSWQWANLETIIDTNNQTIYLGNKKGRVEVLEVVPVRDQSCYGWDPIELSD